MQHTVNKKAMGCRSRVSHPRPPKKREDEATLFGRVEMVDQSHKEFGNVAGLLVRFEFGTHGKMAAAFGEELSYAPIHLLFIGGAVRVVAKQFRPERPKINFSKNRGNVSAVRPDG